jgi:hypothetical protein
MVVGILRWTQDANPRAGKEARDARGMIYLT